MLSLWVSGARPYKAQSVDSSFFHPFLWVPPEPSLVSHSPTLLWFLLL